MTLHLPPYPNYKDSSVNWLGDIPAHWDVCRLKHVAQINPSKSEAQDLLLSNANVSFLPMEKVGTDGQIKTQTLVPIKDVWNGFTYFRKNDVLIAKITPCFENGKGACLDTLLSDVGMGSTEFIVLRARNDTITPRFLWRVTTLAEFRAQGADAMTGAAGQQRVPGRFVDNFASAFPPPDEQSIIVKFLDQLDRRVYRLLRTKRLLIELLNEQKQALILHAVTQGLDPNVPKKPSGIHWLGDIPAHWEMKKLKLAAQVQTGITLGKTYGSETLIEFPYLRVANVQDGFLDLHKITTVRVPLSEADRSRLIAGDVLMTEGGDIDKLGRGYKWQGEIPDCLHQNHVFAVRCDALCLCSDYLVLLMTSAYGRTYFQLTAKKTTNLASTNSTTIKSFPLPLPNIVEQRDILNALVEQTAPLDQATARTQREIELIREYRTRLIADVVTGKLDVRNVPLSEFAEELDSIGDETEEPIDPNIDEIDDEAPE